MNTASKPSKLQVLSQIAAIGSFLTALGILYFAYTRVQAERLSLQPTSVIETNK